MDKKESQIVSLAAQQEKMTIFAENTGNYDLSLGRYNRYIRCHFFKKL